jgi:Tfp pilus assembly protein PilN
MRAINLLPQPERRTPTLPTLLTPRSVLAGGVVMLAAVAVLVGVSFSQSSGKVSEKRDTLAALEQKVNALQAAQSRTAARQGTDTARVAAFTSASGDRMRWDNLLDDISRVLPAGSWLTSLNMQAVTPAAPAAGSTPTTGTTAPTGFTVSGFAFTQDTVALVMDRLERVPALSGVALQSSTRTDVGSTKAYQFTMSANVLAPEVPQ